MNYSKKSKSEVARFDRIDALRGLAIVWMTIFHFCFDLSNFGYLKANFYDDPFWTNQRTCIVSLFLFCAGLGQAVAVSKELSWARFFKRWRQIVGASLLVSAGSYFVFPNSFIYFGILHGIALMLLILRLLTPLTSFFVFIGAAIIGLKFYLNAQMASLIQSSPGREQFLRPWKRR
ncbi:MAG: heparan-alpha-glucosaminide N-acetyltransferase [Pseudobdellovibrio sp.]